MLTVVSVHGCYCVTSSSPVLPLGCSASPCRWVRLAIWRAPHEGQTNVVPRWRQLGSMGSWHFLHAWCTGLLVRARHRSPHALQSTCPFTRRHIGVEVA